MERLVNKYANKLVSAGLAESNEPLLGGLDAELYWNRKDPLIEILEPCFDKLNINSLLCCQPAEPYASIINYLIKRYPNTIFPQDTETRTFLHELPVAASVTNDEIILALARRKSVILPSGKIVTFGTVTPEQCFVVYSSVCFACFVKFHADLLADTRSGKADPAALKIIDEICSDSLLINLPPKLKTGPFTNEKQIHDAMCETGKLTVDSCLVDSFFGNISYLHDDILYISQTGSSLDELEGCIDPCPVNETTSTGITASSELTAHLSIVGEPNINAILHGHPRYCVILSLDCEEEDCPDKGECHVACKKNRFIGDVPIIPGEVGTGPTGLCNTLPNALKNRKSAIVYGHGLFTTANTDFIEAFEQMVKIEKMCFEEFGRRLKNGLSGEHE